MMGVGIQVRKI